jgi:transposase-like protein
MVEFSKEDVIFLVAAVLAQGYITPRLPKLPDGGLFAILNDSTTQSLLIIGAVFLILHSAWEYGKELLSKDEDSGGVGFEVFSGPPSKTLYSAAIRYDDVDWQGQFGTSRGNEVTYVEGPYCPRCQTELSVQNKSRRIRSKQKLWRCPSCDFSTSRETGTRDTQRDMVEKIVENEADDAITNLLAQDEAEIQDTIEEIVEAAVEKESDVEDFIDDPSPETHSEGVQHAIEGAVEDIVGEERIRQDPTLRVVLRKGLGYSVAGDDRNYEIMDEQAFENKVRRRRCW